MQEWVSPESEPGIVAPGEVMGTETEAECCWEPSIRRIHLFRDRLPRSDFSLSRKETQSKPFQKDSPTGGNTASSAREALSLTREDKKGKPLRKIHRDSIYRMSDTLASSYSPYSVQIGDGSHLIL